MWDIRVARGWATERLRKTNEWQSHNRLWDHNLSHCAISLWNHKMTQQAKRSAVQTKKKASGRPRKCPTQIRSAEGNSGRAGSWWTGHLVRQQLAVTPILKRGGTYENSPISSPRYYQFYFDSWASTSPFIIGAHITNFVLSLISGREMLYIYVYICIYVYCIIIYIYIYILYRHTHIHIYIYIYTAWYTRWFLLTVTDTDFKLAMFASVSALDFGKLIYQ